MDMEEVKDINNDDADAVKEESETLHVIAGEITISPVKHDNNDGSDDGNDGSSDLVRQVSSTPVGEEGNDRNSTSTMDQTDGNHGSSSGSNSDVNDGTACSTEEVFPPLPPESNVEVEVVGGTHGSNYDHGENLSETFTKDLDDEIKDDALDQEEKELRHRSGQTRAMFKSPEVEHLRHRIAAASYRLGKTDVAGLFDRLDKDKSGQLELEELSYHLRRLMPTVSKKQVTQFFRAIDTDKSGCVSKEEFIKFIDRRESESPRKRSMTGGQSLAEIQAARAASGNKPKKSSSDKNPPRDPSQSTLMIPTKSRMNDLATFLKNKEEIKDADDPWWEKRPGKLDGLKTKSKQRYANVESKLYQTTHSYESYRTAPTYMPKSPYKTSSPSSSGEIPPLGASGSSIRSLEASQTSPSTVGKMHHMPPGEAEMLRHKFLAASYTTQGPNIGKLFSRMDLKKNGVIDLPELIIAVRKVVPDVTDQIVIHLMEEIDTKKQGHIGLEELEEFINQRYSIQTSPEHQRSGVHRTASKAASELRLQKKVNHPTFATKEARKQQRPQVSKQPIYTIDYEAVMDHHYHIGLEYDRRQQLVETAESIIPNKPSDSLINALSSSIHVVESHEQQEMDKNPTIKFIQYLVDEHDHVWTLHKLHIEYFDNAFRELYHEGLNDFKERNDVPLIDKKPLTEKRQRAEDEYERRNDFVNEAMLRHELPIVEALPDVDDMEENEYSSAHFVRFKSVDNNQSDLVYKYIVFPDAIIYFHSTIPVDDFNFADIEKAKEDYLKKQSRVYCESSASILANKINEEFNNGSVTKFNDDKGSTQYVRDDGNSGGSFGGAGYEEGDDIEGGSHSGPGFLRPTKNSMAGKVSKVITNGSGGSSAKQSKMNRKEPTVIPNYTRPQKGIMAPHLSVYW